MTRNFLHRIFDNACWIITAINLTSSLGAAESTKKPPNVVYILCDDLGYGDVRCLNPDRCKIDTPQLDKLASQGMIFTEAHSSSAVCTPSRYSILTGRYSWRTHLQSGVYNGLSEPLIAADRLTVPALFKQHGYRTACIGKWHLGMSFAKKSGKTDFTQPIQNGPITRGFDSFFGISASLDMPPFAFIENDHFTQTPSVSKKWMREGIAAPDFEAADVIPTFVRKAVEIIEETTKSGKPLFLYLPLTSPHTPLVPSPQWKGKSALGEYGDFVMETDAAIGEVVAAIDKAGIGDNTLILVTSDNGCAPYVGVDKFEAQGHFASGDRRGYKADIWDGGHRIPLIARWPASVKAGTTSAEIVSLTDLLATSADILGVKIPENAGEDSVSILPALQGTAKNPLREAVVFHSIKGIFAIRKGPWKLELCADSGGWSKSENKAAEGQTLPPVQLYDMAKDVGERHNVAKDNPEVVAQLTKLLESYLANGRSTPGANGSNDVPVELKKNKVAGKSKKDKSVKEN